MESATVKVTFNIDKELYQAYKSYCQEQRTNPTNDVRRYMLSRAKNIKPHHNRETDSPER